MLKDLNNSIDLRHIIIILIFFPLASTAMLRNDVGWFDKEENSPEVLSIRLGHDAAYVKATFSNRLSVFMQDIAAVFVALALALGLEWRFGLVALATIPLLVFASITQVFL